MSAATCDRCSAAAPAVWVVLPASGGELEFCAHHYKPHALALEAAGAVVVFLSVVTP